MPRNGVQQQSLPLVWFSTSSGVSRDRQLSARRQTSSTAGLPIGFGLSFLASGVQQLRVSFAAPIAQPLRPPIATMADNRVKAPNPSAALLASAASILANAASDDKSKGGRVFLNTHLDWDDWYREFQTKARLLWPYITRVRPWPVNPVAEPNALHFYNGDADEDGFDQADPQAAQDFRRLRQRTNPFARQPVS